MVDASGNFIEDKKAVWPGLNERLYDRPPYIGQPATFFRRALLDSTGYLDEDFHFAMDFDFWLRLRMRGREFTLTDEVFTCFRVHDQAKSSRGEMEFVRELYRKYSGLKYVRNKDIRNMIRLYSRILVNNGYHHGHLSILARYLLFHPRLALKIARNKVTGHR